MKIITVRNGKAIMVVYMDGSDNKTIQSKDTPAPEFKDAWEVLALDVKMALATQLGVASAKLDGWNQAHLFTFNKIHFIWGEGEKVPDSYEIWGHHHIVDTNYDTDVKLVYNFGDKNSPDKAALTLMREATLYAEKRRGQTSLFEQDSKEDSENNGGNEE